MHSLHLIVWAYMISLKRTGNKAYNLAQDAYHGTLYNGGTGSNTTNQQMWDNNSPGGINTDATNDNAGFGDLFYTYAEWNKPYSIEFWIIPATSGNVYVLTQRGDNTSGKGLYVQLGITQLFICTRQPEVKDFIDIPMIFQL